MGNEQLTAGFYQSGQHLDQMGRIGKIGKGIVNHDGIKLFRKFYGLHIAADYPNLWEFMLCNLSHFLGNVNAGNGGNLTL